MGAADIVPGVSGGTIALITGIYEELITTIKNINLDLFKSFFASGCKKFWIELNGNFLITLLLGIFTSVILLAQVIVFLLENHEYKLWGFFFGLIVASAVLILKDIQSFSINLAFWVLVGIIAAGAISLSNSTNIPNTDVYVFFTGSIAITAMILPGISGSFILLLLSKYEFIINAIKDFELRVIIVFAAGCIFGLIIFSRFLHYLFQNIFYKRFWWFKLTPKVLWFECTLRFNLTTKTRIDECRFYENKKRVLDLLRSEFYLLCHIINYTTCEYSGNVINV